MGVCLYDCMCIVYLYSVDRLPIHFHLCPFLHIYFHLFRLFIYGLLLSYAISSMSSSFVFLSLFFVFFFFRLFYYYYITTHTRRVGVGVESKYITVTAIQSTQQHYVNMYLLPAIISSVCLCIKYKNGRNARTSTTSNVMHRKMPLPLGNCERTNECRLQKFSKCEHFVCIIEMSVVCVCVVPDVSRCCLCCIR